jgi:hypothetical protein
MAQKIQLPKLPFGQHYARVTFPMSWCRHDYESPREVARGFARDAGLEIVNAQVERGTVAVYVIEPPVSHAPAWDRYRSLKCTSAARV